MKTPGQIAYENYREKAGLSSWPWDSLPKGTQAEWEKWAVLPENSEYLQCSTETQTTNTERTDSMLYRVALTVKPSELEKQAGVTERIILPSVEVTADCEAQAIAVAVNAATKLEPTDVARCSVYVKQF